MSRARTRTTLAAWQSSSRPRSARSTPATRSSTASRSRSNARDRLALSGPNGAGKTTLLRGLMGETELQGGELAWEKGARVALHDQRPPRLNGQTLREYALSGAADLVAAEQELRRLEEAMAGGDHTPETLRRYGETQARLEHAGGYGWRDRATSVLRGLGFTDPDLERDLESFSGGELTRASLARALAGQPDLLLLDEPTNHLDMASIEWLEQELTTLDAAIVLVAHDRWFLESVGTAVLELEGGKSVYFPGKWHVWRQEKAARLAMQARFAERQAEDIERLERFVARFRYGTKSRQAQAKLKQIARIEKVRVEAPSVGRRTLGFEFLKPARSGRTVVEARADRPRRGRQAAARGHGARARARRARRADRPERLGEDHAARGARARPRRPFRPRRRAGVLLAARRRAGRARQRARVRDGRDRAAAAAGSGAPRPLPLLRLGRPREEGRLAFGRRAAAARARADRRLRRELPRPRRADEPPRSGEPRGARGGARGVSRHDPARLARPGGARRRRRANRRDRRRATALLPGRLGRLRADPLGRGRASAAGPRSRSRERRSRRRR